MFPKTSTIFLSRKRSIIKVAKNNDGDVLSSPNDPRTKQIFFLEGKSFNSRPQSHIFIFRFHSILLYYFLVINLCVCRFLYNWSNGIHQFSFYRVNISTLSLILPFSFSYFTLFFSTILSWLLYVFIGLYIVETMLAIKH
jgi:hypothetical protein